MTKPDYSWIKYKNRSLEFTRKKAPPFEEWEASMAALNLLYDSGGFYRGDLYIAGESWFGETKASSVFDPLTWQVKTWQNCASVCGRIDRSQRREELSYSHHAEVAYLEPDQFPEESALAQIDTAKIQDWYLTLAIEKGLSIRKLRDLINADKGREQVSFETDEFDERARKLAEKVATLIEKVEFSWPTTGEHALGHLTAAYDNLEAASSALATVLKKAGKKAA